MKLLKYKLEPTTTDEWNIEEIVFGRINLLVGDSGTGKTRFVNTIVNFTRQLVSEKVMFTGDWTIEFEVNEIVYKYKLIVMDSKENPNEKYIEFEELLDITNNVTLIKRENDVFYWKSSSLPKLGKSISGIFLLKEEEIIKDIFSSFKRIVARRFSGDELNTNFQFSTLLPNSYKKIVDAKNMQALINDNVNFHNKMFMLKAIDIEIYNKIIGLYKSAFPYIIDVQIAALNQVLPGLSLPINAPAFCIKEKNINSWIPVNDISSGMQKIFLLILDIFLLKDNGILLIDEYENSLGINAINFLPELIYSISDNCQFIITSHHPYIINNIPLENWIVFHRNGLTINVRSGKVMKEKYKQSKQEQFVQLINDPFYTGGIE